MGSVIEQCTRPDSILTTQILTWLASHLLEKKYLVVVEQYAKQTLTDSSDLEMLKNQRHNRGGGNKYVLVHFHPSRFEIETSKTSF